MLACDLFLFQWSKLQTESNTCLKNLPLTVATTATFVPLSRVILVWVLCRHTRCGSISDVQV